MIRAVKKSDDSFLYIYYIYEAKNYSTNKICTYCLCSECNHIGLIAREMNEIKDIEVLEDSYLFVHEKDERAGKNDRIHPVLSEFLHHDDWRCYEGVVEGDPDLWLEFEKRLGHRP